MPYCESLLVNVVYNGVYYGLYELSEKMCIRDSYIAAQRGSEDSTIEELLDRYAAMNSHISVKTVDPVTNPTFIEQYTTKQLSQNSVIAVSGKRCYAVAYNEIYTVTYSDEELYYYLYYGQQPTGTPYFNGELCFTTALDYVTRNDLPKAYMLMGHGETALSETCLLYTSFVSKLPVAPSTSITSHPAQIPIPLIRSTAEMMAHFSPHFSLNEGRAGFFPGLQSLSLIHI